MGSDGGARIERYATRIVRYWRRKFPWTCESRNPESLWNQARDVAEEATAARSAARERGEPEHLACVAAVDVWAVPPNPNSAELVNAMCDLLNHRWRRLWPDAYERLSRDPWWDPPLEEGIVGSGKAVDVLVKTVECVMDYPGDERPWHEVIAGALDEHGRLPVYVEELADFERAERARRGSGRLECRREDFVRALQLLKAAQRTGASLVITLIEGELELRRAATCVRIPARGSWPGTATVSALVVRELWARRKALPDPVIIDGTTTHLGVGAYALPCSWSDRPVRL